MEDNILLHRVGLEHSVIKKIGVFVGGFVVVFWIFHKIWFGFTHSFCETECQSQHCWCLWTIRFDCVLSSCKWMYVHEYSKVFLQSPDSQTSHRLRLARCDFFQLCAHMPKWIWLMENSLRFEMWEPKPLLSPTSPHCSALLSQPSPLHCSDSYCLFLTAAERCFILAYFWCL